MIDNGRGRDKGMRLSRRLVLGVASPAALALPAANAVATYLKIVTIGDNSRLSTRSRTILGVARDTFSALQDAEASERGFLLTGEDAYLEPYREASRTLPGRLSRLISLTARDSAQARRAEALRDLA